MDTQLIADRLARALPLRKHFLRSAAAIFARDKEAVVFALLELATQLAEAQDERSLVTLVASHRLAVFAKDDSIHAMTVWLGSTPQVATKHTGQSTDDDSIRWPGKTSNTPGPNESPQAEKTQNAAHE